ncbi:MAG TPA: ChaN family lipoprotein, partial [Nitrospirota bacterium]|nr:ChaN family lipoprotein [Nitrospirota bacterium]
MKKNLLSLFILLFLCFAAESGVSADNVLRVRDGKIITFHQMIEEVKKVNIVFFGEIHDSIEHHEAELAVIRALHESDTPMSIGLEMFRSDSQSTLDSWTRGKSSLEQFLPAYYDNWRMPWIFYREIFWYS